MGQGAKLHPIELMGNGGPRPETRPVRRVDSHFPTVLESAQEVNAATRTAITDFGDKPQPRAHDELHLQHLRRRQKRHAYRQRNAYDAQEQTMKVAPGSGRVSGAPSAL
jgi:hypothetical protein